MTKLAITGIGGFIGLRMVERARARGLSVCGLDVSPGAAERARAAGAEVVVGGVNDEAAVRAALSGAEVVFHTAAIVEEDGPRELYERVNVEGTRTVARVARDLGVRRFVHLSSVMVYGFDYPDGVTENGPFCTDDNVYNVTKLRSERVAMEFHAPGAMEVIVIRPGDVYGPGSVPWVERPLAMMRRGLFALPAGGALNHVHVDNLLDGVFLALDRGATGEAFNVSDGVATPNAEYFGLLARMIGRSGVRTFPGWLMHASAWALGAGFHLAKRKPPVSPAGIHFLSRRGHYSIAKARRVLGYEPRISLAEGMRGIEERLATLPRG